MSRPDRFRNGQNPYALPRWFIGIRDRRIDFLRGFAALAISANHIWPQRVLDAQYLYPAYKLGHFFAFDFADVFLLLSGIVAGLVFFPLFREQGLRKYYARSLRRVGQIWGVHILCVLAALPIILIFEQGLGVTGSLLSPFEHSVASGFARNLLPYHPSALLDILPVYIHCGWLTYGLCIMANVGLCLLSGHLLERRRTAQHKTENLGTHQNLKRV